MPGHVFISYAQADRKIAEKIRAGIEAAGIRCWIAPRDILPGQNYPSAILNAVDYCAVFLLIFSKKANTSVHVPNELGKAFDKGKTIIPIRIDNASPSGDLDYFLGRKQWFDASSGPIEKYIPAIVQVIKGKIPPPPPPRRLLLLILLMAAIFVSAAVIGIFFWNRNTLFNKNMAAFKRKCQRYVLLAYDPTGFDPYAKRYPIPESIKADMRILEAHGFYGVITFGSMGTLAKVPEIAKRVGMKFVIMGIWDPKNEREVENAIQEKRFVDGYCVGHSGLESRYTMLNLKIVLSRIKSVTHRPASVSEKVADYASIPELLKMGDWIFPDVHAFWHEGGSPAKMAEWTIAMMKRVNRMTAGDPRPVILKMISFPSGPKGISSEDAQARFYKRLLTEVRDRADVPDRVTLSFLGAFDPIWKRPDRGWAETERFTGLFTYNRKPKKVVEVFDEMRKKR